MPSLAEIATAQPSFQSFSGTLRAQTPIHVKGSISTYSFGNEKGFTSAWIALSRPKRLNFNVGQLENPGGRFLIRAVATLEPKCLVHNEKGKMGFSDSHNGHAGCKDSQLGLDSSSSNVQLLSSREDSEDLDERERLRRMRISKANKGNTPWNKGKKHSTETLQRIRERTRLAMQDPKVKMKLINLGHAQSEETRMKIGVGVRMGWQRRRERLMLQETCHFEWQNLIAEASRQGYDGEDELQWDSYMTLDLGLKEEWLESVEQRKKTPRPNGSRRAPKSAEQRRKISEAIHAKWADPDYRERVCSALAKYHGTPAGAERKPRRKPRERTDSPTRSPPRKKINSDSSSVNQIKIQSQRSKSRKSNAPRFKDPLASSKLEMIKSIRAQRGTVETQKTEAIERARLLIAEAEKAAKALELAAMNSPIALASLMETRKLIAEAIQSLESIEIGHMTSQNAIASSATSNDLTSLTGNETLVEVEVKNEADQRKVNGTQSLSSSKDEGFDFGKLNTQDLLSDEEEFPTSFNGYSVSNYSFLSDSKQNQLGSISDHAQPNENEESEEKPPINGEKIDHLEEENVSNPATVTKRWVRGRLIEVAEEA